MLPVFQPSAFVVGEAAVRAGVQYRSIPNVPAGGGALNLQALGPTSGAEIDVKLLEWLAIETSLGGSSLTGANARSVAAFGGAYDYGVGAGLGARVVRFDRTHTQLAAHLAASASAGKLLALPDLAGVTTAVAGSLALGQAVSPAFGVQLSLGLAYAFTTASPADTPDITLTSSVTTPTIGFAASWDFAPGRSPISGLAEYVLALPSNHDLTGARTARANHTIAFGAFYAARKDLQLGLVGSAQLALDPMLGQDAGGALAPSDRPTAVGAQFVFRYLW
jgi:hypothetical protein